MTPGEELAQYLGAKTGSLDGTKLVPMLCEREEAGSRVLGRKGWLFELKLDGVRIIADKNNEKVSLCYRKLRDAGVLGAEHAEVLISATRLLHDLTQIVRLCLEGSFDPATAPAGLKRLLAVVGEARDFAELEERLRSQQQQVAELFEILVG